jgi:hypothetical protein
LNVLLLVIDRSNGLSNGAKSTACPKDGAIYSACIFSLYLKHLIQATGQLLLSSRPGNPFPALLLTWSKARAQGTAATFMH